MMPSRGSSLKADYLPFRSKPDDVHKEFPLFTDFPERVTGLKIYIKIKKKLPLVKAAVCYKAKQYTIKV